MTLQVLMTPDCQVICVGDDGQFRSFSLTGDGEMKGLIGVVRQGAHWYLRSIDEPVRWYDPSVQKMVSLLPAQGVEFEVQGIGLNLLRAGQKYLSVDWSGHIRFDTAQATSAAILRFVPLDDLNRLRAVLRQRWVSGPGGKRVRLELERSTLEEVFVGGAKFSFDQFMEGVRQFEKIGELLLNEDWKICRFVPFRPLVVLEAFGQDSLKEIRVLLQSLSEIGRYRDEIIITTNQSEEDVKAVIPKKIAKAQLRIIPVNDHDRFAAFRTRARLLADPTLLEGYAPIIFCGSGIVFDGNINRFLGRAALGRQVSAWGYFYHPEFSLSQQEKEAAQTLEAGQTADLLIVPNVRLHRPYLEGAFDLLRVCIQEYGEDAIPEDVQCVLNYGLRQVGDFSPYLAEGVMHSDCTTVQLNPFHAIGMTGFGKGEDRCERMERYLKTVEELWGSDA